MAASVRVEDEAFSDRRYERLAMEAGLTDADHARGKMAVLWRQCTIERRYQLDPQDVIAVLGERGVEALVASRLGEVVGDQIRICGTRGRIEWRDKLRKNGLKGGRPKGKRNNQLVSTLETKSEPGTRRELNPPAPAPAPIQREEREPGEPGVLALPEPVPPTPTKLSKHEQLAAQLAATACAEINRLRGSDYRPDGKSTLELCSKLAKAKHTADEVRSVVQSKRGWIGHPTMHDRFVPSTLLARANFEKYLEDLKANARQPSLSGTAPIRIASSTSDDEPYLGEPLPQIPAQPEAS